MNRRHNLKKPMKKILTVFGTRPEAIKMAPLIFAMNEDCRFISECCVTAQHRELLDQVLNFFNIQTNYDLDIMKKDQKLNEIISSVLLKMDAVLNSSRPDMVLVHGDTSTTFAAALGSFFKQIPVGHVEAGLRTGDIYSPWPEEANRKLTATITNYHFAPTNLAKNNLINEGYLDTNIQVTGNTVVDALFMTLEKLNENSQLSKRVSQNFQFLDESRRLILVTGHRRENFGDGFKRICISLKEIAERNKDTQIVYPVHLNPNVKDTVEKLLCDIPNIYLIDNQEYLPFVYLMNRSYMILTDSGGIQEEAPSIGKPVLVMREKTERPEAIESGTVKLVGTEVDMIVESTQELLNNDEIYNHMSNATNPYGDGHASERILDFIDSL